jgi:RND family efflux transporter MFP subunit
MNVMRGWVRVLAAGIVVVGVGACGGSGDGNEALAQGAPSEAGFARVINVEVRPIEAERFVEQVRLTGVVGADRDVVVGAEESGRVVEVLVAKGQWVADGEPLVRLDSELLEAQVDQAEARATLAEETWQRRRRLWEQDRVGTELAYLEAQASARETAATLRNLRERLNRTVVRAPFAGVVEDRSVEQGSLVAPGSPIARIVDLSPLEIVAGVPERYAADIRPGAMVSVTLDAVPGAAFEGRVRFVGSTVDPQSRTFPVELTLPNPSGAIKPEMVANVSVERRAIDNALVASQDAVVRVENGFVVYVVTGPEGAETVEARPVTVRASQANRVVLEGDLAVGDRIVVAGHQLLAAGDRVRIVEAR